MPKHRKTVSDITAASPIGLDRNVETLETNQVIYAFAHDVLHWVLHNHTAREMFRDDLHEILISQGMAYEDLPTMEDVESALTLSHNGISMMSKIADGMSPGDLP